MIKVVRPNETRAKQAQLLLYIVIGLDLVLLISNLFQYLLIEDLIAGKFIGDDTIDANDVRQQIIAVLFFAGYVTSAVYYIRWFRRAYYNLGQAVHTEYDEGWAAGGWFVPIISLYYPYKIMKELYVKTNAILRDQITGYSKKINVTMITIWWALWIGTNLIETIGGKFENYDSLEGILNSTIFGMFTNILGIVLAFAALKVIKDYHELEKKYHKLADNQLSGTALPEITL